MLLLVFPFQEIEDDQYDKLVDILEESKKHDYHKVATRISNLSTPVRIWELVIIEQMYYNAINRHNNEQHKRRVEYARENFKSQISGESE